MTRAELLLTLNATPGLGPLKLQRVLERWGSLIEAGGPLGARELIATPGVGKRIAAAFEQRLASGFAARELEALEALGGWLLTPGDPRYPAALEALPDPPQALYARGALPRGGAGDPWPPALAMVGSRKASSYGLRQAEQIAFTCAALGVPVVSGMARGIDSAAHRGALAAGGPTVAVLGCGVDRPWPDRQLGEEIAARGLLLSEFPLGAPPLAGHFPRRNRLIAGLALGTLVLEATLRSGSLVTARLALEANRDVLALPGPVDVPGSAGPHQLIREGAALATGAEDVLDLLPGLLPAGARASATSSEGGPDPVAAVSDPLQRALLGALRITPQPLGGLLRSVEAPAPRVMAALCLLTLAGQVVEHPGQRFSLPAA